MHDLVKQFDDLSRRRFVACAAGTFLGVKLLGPAGAAHAQSRSGSPRRPNPARNVIYLFMDGGISHLDTFDPKTHPDVQGPVESISTKTPGLRFTEYIPKLAQLTDKMTVIRSLTSIQGEHERGRYLMRTSYNMMGTVRHPAMGAWLLNLGASGRSRSALPGNVLIGGGTRHPAEGFLESQYAPLRIGNPLEGLQDAQLPPDITQQQFQRRLQLANRFDRSFRQRYPHENVQAYSGFYDDAVRLMRSDDLQAFEIARESREVREAYGNNRFGQGCLLARRLVQHGVRYIEVNQGGWDTHENNFDAMPDRCAVIDRAIATLIQDLEANGLLDETMVVLATEFGRTPRINDQAGRDHHPRAFSGFIAGGGVQGGAVYGQTDDQADTVTENPVEIPDYNATIAYGLGLPLDRRVQSSSGRPFTVAHEGKPVTAIF